MGLSLEIIESGQLLPEEIMAKDAEILAQLDPEGPSILHFYDWSVPSLTYGYFTDPFKYLDLEALERHGIHKARRPTGGGIIFHLTDLAFSIFIPYSHSAFSLNTLDNYALINRKVIEAINEFAPNPIQPQLLSQEDVCSKNPYHGFCMAKPTEYDVMMDGKKVGGAAQRRTKKGFLHQGSLSLFPPPLNILRDVLKNNDRVVESMHQHSHYLAFDKTNEIDLITARQELKINLRRCFGRSH